MIASKKYILWGVIVLVCFYGCGVRALTSDTIRTVSAGGVSIGAACESTWMCGQALDGMSRDAQGVHIQVPGNDRDQSVCSKTVFLGAVNQVVYDDEADNDADGIPDENDLDDDNDGVCDIQELAGSANVPPVSSDSLLADTDGDGADDYEEAKAGTDPTDPGQYLSVLGVEAENGSSLVTVSWNSRYGRSYRVLRADSMYEMAVAPEEVAVIQAADGVDNPPWYAGITEIQVSDPANRSVYRVSVAEP